MKVQNKLDVSGLLDEVDESKLGSGAKVTKKGSKKKTTKKKRLKLKLPTKPLDSLNLYGK